MMSYTDPTNKPEVNVAKTNTINYTYYILNSYGLDLPPVYVKLNKIVFKKCSYDSVMI